LSRLQEDRWYIIKAIQTETEKLDIRFQTNNVWFSENLTGRLTERVQSEKNDSKLY
jgi:hypothetical protein